MKLRSLTLFSGLALPCASPTFGDEALVRQLQTDVRHLAGAIGERNLYHPQKLAAAAEWIEGRFKHMGYQQVRRLPVPVHGDDFALPADTIAFNIEAVLPGTSMPEETLVIGAHYDTKVAMPRWNAHWPPTPDKPGTPGANDNGSGVAAMLALAEYFVGRPHARTLRFVAFVNEEPPFYQTEAMGSLVYARSLKAQGITQVRMITPETLGCFSARSNRKRTGAVRLLAAILRLPPEPDYVSFSSNWSSRRWMERFGQVFATRPPLALRAVALPAFSKKVAWSDDWSFWQCGYPAFAVTDTAYLRSDQYHELWDTPDSLDYEPLAGVVQALGATVADVVNDPAPWEPWHCRRATFR